MLKPKALTNVLKQANSGGVESTLLLTTGGSLLACAGYGDRDKHVAAALAGNVWVSFCKNSEILLRGDPLDIIIIQCMGGNVAITKVANLLLCLYAKKETPLGMLKAKVKALSEYLNDPLTQVASN